MNTLTVNGWPVVTLHPTPDRPVRWNGHIILKEGDTVNLTGWVCTKIDRLGIYDVIAIADVEGARLNVQLLDENVNGLAAFGTTPFRRKEEP